MARKRKRWLEPAARAYMQAWIARKKAENPEAFAERGKEYTRAYRRRHPERQAPQTRKSRLKMFWGMTEEKYEQMLAAQKGVCAICLKPPRRTRLCIDHDHKCCGPQKACAKCIRGLVCFPCNQLVAFVEQGKYERAVEYIKKYGGEICVS